jgi:4-amino-4-deoxy-L-arabinose transferase-like glycosyltransferase
VAGVCNHAHNIVLQLLAETGIAGAVLFAGAAALVLSDLRRAEFGMEWWWLLALLAVLGIHSLLEFPLWYAYFLGIAALLAGLGSQRAVRVRHTGAARAVAALFVLSGALNVAAVLGPYREFERLVFDPNGRAARAMTDGKFAGALTRLRREPVLAPYVELALALGMEVSSERLGEKLEINTRALHFAPAYPVALRQSMLLALAGEAAAAAHQLERVARAYPHGLEDAQRQLAAAALRHPAELTPLLELAAARRAELRGAGSLEDGALRR